MSNHFRIERKTEVLKRIPFSKATLHRRINDGTFPPSISLGANSVGFLTHEVDTIIAAMVMDQDLKKVVANLLAQRQSLLANSLYQKAA